MDNPQYVSDQSNDSRKPTLASMSFLTILLLIAVAVIVAIAYVFIFKVVWNNSVIPIFGLKQEGITMLQAFLLLVLARMLIPAYGY